MNYPMTLLDPIKEYLEEKKRELAHRKERLVENVNNEVEEPELDEHQSNLVMIETVDRSIAEVDRALSRIDQGNYGNCLACGAMIDTDRLKIEPTAEYCVDCQRKQSAS